ncbi:MAG: hypothetical protein R3B84_06920 [Zavarzinella sp.]
MFEKFAVISAEQPVVQRPQSKIPWWLWPNLLACDAPIIAVVWQLFIAYCFHMQVPAGATLTLAAVVWLIYLLDRKFDAGQQSTGLIAPRHYFAGHSHFYSTLILIVAVVAIVSSYYLPMGYWQSGSIIALLVVLYLAIIHFLKIPLCSSSPTKEFMVGIVFSGGVCLPAFAGFRLPSVDEIWVIIGFAATCFVNCLLITTWESNKTYLKSIFIAFCIGMICLVFVPVAISVSIGLAMLGMWLLHGYRRKTSLSARRVAVDTVLLYPILTMLIMYPRWESLFYHSLYFFYRSNAF